MSSALARRSMRVVLTAVAAPRDPALRAPVLGDVHALAALMGDAYRGTVDDAGEGPQEWLLEIEKTHRGEYGPYVAACSRVYEHEGRIVSATLITRWQGRPFVAFTMTAPASARRGRARACMLSAMASLHAAGERELRLVVTTTNARAIRLYESLGFAFED